MEDILKIYRKWDVVGKEFMYSKYIMELFYEHTEEGTRARVFLSFPGMQSSQLSSTGAD